MVKPMNMSDCFAGLHDDEKPAGVYNGSCFIEMDTGKVYFYDAANSQWIEFGGSSDSSNNNAEDNG